MAGVINTRGINLALVLKIFNPVKITVGVRHFIQQPLVNQRMVNAVLAGAVNLPEIIFDAQSVGNYPVIILAVVFNLVKSGFGFTAVLLVLLVN